ncbi:hypothetical protein A1O7_05787 [Cladophialophora yegresii CBS 114405]|uniref:Uncharacterized protein n=1 Tax=Cladophialophora yegresii CBS 114405 TaxID=1182544 RepID=W9VRP7_9EURO|nr:uncharacterized protein A1O7_05787 [Cladophialophora yegresii CBS 114405]EXJ58362.1 hypothetical protein A1O7_05787 [Cladophialophora yegresii CBS 114405]
MPQPGHTTSPSQAAQTYLPVIIKWGAITTLILSILLFSSLLTRIIPEMPPVLFDIVRRNFDPGEPSSEFWAQWKNPGDVFSVLLILGGDVVGRALAQLAGSRLTPVAFSFGWVAFAVTAVVSAVGENKLMPLPDCACKVINGESGYVRENTSWIIGRIVRDFDHWKDPAATSKVKELVEKKFEFEKAQALQDTGSSASVEKSTQAGLCVSIYEAEPARRGYPGYDSLYWVGFLTTIVQLGIAAIPAGIFGDWGIFLITIAGILLSVVTGTLPQWAKEKWACRSKSKKIVILTRGNGSQHAVVILGNGNGLDLEDLAAGQTNVDVSASWFTRVTLIALALLWILLLITAAGIQQNTWFLLAIGGVGILQNIFVAGWRRDPKAFGVPLKFLKVIGENKVMEALYKVEEEYHHVGASLIDTFFPGKLRSDEKTKWEDYEKIAKQKDDAAKKAARASKQQNGGSQNTTGNSAQGATTQTQPAAHNAQTISSGTT